MTLSLLTRPDCQQTYVPPALSVNLSPFLPVPARPGLSCLQTPRTMSPLTRPDCHPLPALSPVPPPLPAGTSQSLSIPQLLQVKVKLFCWQSGRVNRLWVLEGGGGGQQRRCCEDLGCHVLLIFFKPLKVLIVKFLLIGSVNR